MIQLSINIPTYNRCVFLQKNISIIIGQIRKFSLEHEVEINISDNASTDTTKEIIEELTSDNPDIQLTYQRQIENIGPDRNFISAMNMAKGEYSILFGDDDYLKPDIIPYILETVYNNAGVSVFLCNCTYVDVNGRVLRDSHFLRSGVSTQIFDFKYEHEARSYFSLCEELGGALTFISSVVYKTSIIEEVGVYDEIFNGTNYSFLYYFWTYLLRGNKLLYSNESNVFCTTTGATNNNYGKGIKRLYVDISGFAFLGNHLFINSSLKQDFMNIQNRNTHYLDLLYGYITDKEFMNKDLIPSLNEIGWGERNINDLKTISSRKYKIDAIRYELFPRALNTFLHTIKKKFKKKA